MRSIDQLCDVVNPTAGTVVAAGVVHPNDWGRGNRSVLHAGRVVRMPNGIEVLQHFGSLRSLPHNWRQVAARQGQSIE